LSRSLSLSLMDFPSALDQMSLLLSLNPSSVYKTSYYRKQTKNHWARDDPAFIILTFLLLIISTICYSIAFTLSLSGFIYLLLANFVIYAGLGLGVCMGTRYLANSYLTTHSRRSHSVKQTVELMYSFDIHCNSFLILFVYLHILQFFLLPILLTQTFLSLILSNFLYTAALSHYFYITHLGFRALPFLINTQYFLYPIVAFVGLFLLGIV
ncbi:hypothetical protein TL16_g11368, partial [Triparma laevis f. inornata]